MLHIKHRREGESWYGRRSLRIHALKADNITHISQKEQTFPAMVATFSAVTLCCVVLLATVQAFSPTNAAARCSVRGSTIVMDGKTRDLRDRIKSIKNTRRITEAMRLVAAARVRRAQEAVLKTRPLISQLQMVSLIISIHLKRYPIAFRYNDSHSVR